MSKLVQVSPRVRVEPGPVRRTAVATEELLSDAVTARHYKPTPKDPETGDFVRDKKGGFIGPRDAAGKPIVLGEEMTYLDWRGKRVWKIYLHDGKRYRWHDERETYEEAVAEAAKLAAKEGDL